MATIVRHTPTGRQFILVGVGHDSGHKSLPLSVPNGAKSVESSQNALAAVCDEDGCIYWCETKELEVVSINGRSPAEILNSN